MELTRIEMNMMAVSCNSVFENRWFDDHLFLLEKGCKMIWRDGYSKIQCNILCNFIFYLISVSVFTSYGWKNEDSL